MVSVPDSGWSGPSSGSGRGHCVVFLGKTPYSLHLGVQMSTGESNARGNHAMD